MACICIETVVARASCREMEKRFTTMAFFFLTSALNNVDLPTLGLPKIAILNITKLNYLYTFKSPSDVTIINLSSINIGSVPKRSKFIDFKNLPFNGSIIFK